jgi:hypothetical protein
VNLALAKSAHQSRIKDEMVAVRKKLCESMAARPPQPYRQSRFPSGCGYAKQSGLRIGCEQDYAAGAPVAAASRFGVGEILRVSTVGGDAL